MRLNHRALFVACVLSGLMLSAAGCRAGRRVTPGADPMLSVRTLIDAPEDFARRRVGSDDYSIPPYAKFLKGVRICLNPGHGGDAHKRGFKRGPTGVREAEINLRVAKYLREFLVVAGAEVLLTREDDIELSYEERAAIAADWNADLFLSLHHNAIDNKPQANYTTVWYHGDVDYRPSNLDLARYLCEGLLDGLRVPTITDVPLKSDLLMYEQGFAVLRHAKMTAALTESSFYTNPAEEQRLRDPAYNLREAYALFLALAKYALAGLPRAALVEPADAVIRGGATRLVFELDDGLRSRKAWGHERTMILRDSIAVRIDGERVAHRFDDDGERYTLVVNVPAGLAVGEHAVEVQFQNLNKNSVLNPHFEFLVE
ncbi:MAG: N-acetylmuramoyl-L-alanine amidase [Planctomycetota bacterium]|nr:MAG: N-acetylmuramoyl-L-alanine amidase [Planctomycetota bacterium]